MANYTIKPATPDDIPDLLTLVLGLAVYEKEPDAVVATPAHYQKCLFDDKVANAFIARDEAGKPVGMAIYCFNFSTWLGAPGLWLEDLFVVPECRAGGLGKKLFGEIGKVALAKGCQRVEWRVLKWNTPSVEFYEKRIGSEPMPEWETERLEGTAKIETLAALAQ